MIVRVLGALGVGALAMYFFDPVSGARRRARLRAQTARDLGSRAHGLVADAREIVDRRLAQRRQSAAVDMDLSQP